ncbi:MAG: metallophosphoesterase [bacterium]|nr:metallophosphoesterase [bacterium]
MVKPAVLLCAAAFAQCGSSDGVLPLIARGDAVRIVAAGDGNGCPQNWGAGDFDDSGWQKVTLPMASVPTGGVCLRAAFDIGASLPRYRWLHITLSSRSRARLNVGKPITGDVQPAGLDWSTDDDTPPAAAPSAANRSYTLDLRLFPSLLQAQRNVLALEIPETGTPVDIQAVLAEDDGSPDDIVSLTKAPYRVRPTATSVRIAWESDRSAPSWLVVDGQQYDGGWSVHHEVEVQGLVAGRVYSYWISTAQASALPAACQAIIATPANRKLAVADLTDDEFAKYLSRRDACNRLAAAIHSPPRALRSTALGAPVRIALVGDTRAGDTLSPALLDVIAAEQPDLIVHTGDVVADGADAQWQTFFDAGANLLAAVPLAPVPGERDLVPWPGDGDRFSQLFGLVGAAGRAYSVDVGAVHLALLDSTASLDDQAVWLENDLTAAAGRGVGHSFVILHWGPWTGGAAGRAALAAIVPVAQRHGVQAIVSGHENLYEHGVAGGQHYFVTGGGGATVDRAVPKPTTVMSRGVPHYLMLEVSGDTATMRAKDAAGAIFDEVTL